MTIELRQPTPILRMFDEAKAREFYAAYLGFSINWEHRYGDDFPLYLEIQRGGCTIHLSAHHGDCTPVSALRIPVNDSKALHAEITTKQYRYAKPGYDAQDKEFCITDPFGNRLMFHDSD
jgi:uncharacterized glyoxalase superfamily protein PhnB